MHKIIFKTSLLFKSHPSKKINGFTLVELLVTISVVTILLTIAQPSFVDMFNENRNIAKVNLLIRDINLARTEAVNRRVDVWIASIGGGWDNGWTIFSDIDGDATLDDDGDSTLCETGEDCEIKRREALEHATFSTTPVSWPKFNSRGQLDQSYSLVYRPATCPTGEDKEFRITISAFARASVIRGACP